MQQKSFQPSLSSTSYPIGRILGVLSSIAIFTTLLLALTQVAAATNFSQSDFTQCSNENNTLGQCNWIGSNVQSNNSVYIEGMALAQRMMFDGVTARATVPTTTHVLEWDTEWTKGGKHAYDYLVSYAQAQALSTAIGGFSLTMNQCSQLGGGGPPTSECTSVTGVSGFHLAVNVPDDPYVSAECDTGLCNTQDRIDKFEALFGNRTIDVYTDKQVTATLTMTHDVANLADTGDNFQHWTLTIVPTDTANPPTIILVQAAGHIAPGWDPENEDGVGWGGQFSAGNIAGSPYHFKNLQLDSGGGSQDNQLNATAIPVRPTLSTTVANVSGTYPFSITDTATAVGTNGLGAPQGKIYFYVCGPTVTPTACNTNTATIVSKTTLVTGANNTSTATSSAYFPSNSTGYWCFAIGYSRVHTNPPGYDHYSNETSTLTTNECVLITSNPTAAELVLFKGQLAKRGVRLQWETGTEMTIMGFNVWRRARGGAWQRLNAAAIPAKNLGRIEGSTYSYRDRTAGGGAVYRYKLEILETLQASKWSSVVRVK